MDDGVRLWTATDGPGGAPVVLLHGGPGMWDYLAPVADLLSSGDGAVVHRFDQRGCGRSDPSDDQRMDRLVADLDALRRHWGHERWSVVGHSFGAALGLAYAWAHPGRTASLVYVSGTGLGDWKTPYRTERSRRMTAEQRARLSELKAAEARTPAEEREYRALAWFTDHADRERAWQWAWEDAAAPYAVNTEANRRLGAETDAWSGEEVRRRCADLRTPVTVVHGSGDPRPSSAAARLAGVLPNARFHLIEGAGHHPWREHPDELRSILRTALQGAAGEHAARRSLSQP